MNMEVIKNLVKAFEDIKMLPFDDVLSIVNTKVGFDVYFLLNNNILLQENVDEEAMVEQGFPSAISAYYPCIESLCPLKISNEHGHVNNLTIVPNDINIDIDIDNSLYIKAKKQFLIDYCNNLKSNSKKNLTALSNRKKSIQKHIEDINSNKDKYILNYSNSKCFITEQEFINKDFVVVELPIFPTNEALLAVVKGNIVNGLQYAHDLNNLNYKDYINDIKLKDGHFIVSSYAASKYNLTPLDTKYILENFPNIYDYITEKNILEENIANIEKEITFINDLKKEENFINVTKFIEDNIN